MKKLGLLVMPLMAISLLASCNNNGGDDPGPTPESIYTITIEDAAHFSPDHTSLTFKKDDFSPIVLPYTTEQDYFVLNVKASDNAAECHVDYRGDEDLITITPCKNTDFTVKVSMTHLTEWSLIRIKGGNGFCPETNRIVFRNDDLSTKTVHYTLDECDIEGIKVDESKATCEIDEEGSNLIITPINSGSILVEVTVSQQYKNITFNPNKGTLAGSAKEMIRVPYNSYWGDHVDSNVQYANFKSFTFRGWSFAEDPALGSVVLQHTYTLRKSDPTTVYAVYQHDVQLTSESLDFNDIEYYASTNKIRIVFKLKNISGKYILPKDENSFTVTNSSGTPIEVGNYKIVSQDKAYIEIPKDTDIEDGIIKIFVVDYQPTYTVDASSITADDHLTYSAANEPKRGENFVFTLEAVNIESTNDAEHYYVPIQKEQINISIKEGETYSRLIASAYQIEFDPSDTYHQKGTITVFDKYIKGDLKIDATAAVANGYFFALIGCGITFENQSDYLSDYYNTEEIHVGAEVKYLNDDEAAKRVKTDNIAIRAVTSDGTETWYTLKDFSGKYGKESIYYDPIHKLFAFWDLTGNDISAVYIHVYDPQLSIFNNASWAQLGELISLPATYINLWFDAGETRTIQIDNLTYTLRIIGINHDELADGSGKKAGLTIEFVNLISNSAGGAIKTIWNEMDYEYNNTNFPTSEFNVKTLTPFFDKLPLELQAMIKEVSKPVGLGEHYTVGTYTTKLFPLSVREMHSGDIGETADEGETYEYYRNGGSKVKTTINGASFSYWLRSPMTSGEIVSRYVRKDGVFDDDQIYHDDHGFAPAFCI